jgi:hypothetical protein
VLSESLAPGAATVAPRRTPTLAAPSGAR